MQAIADHQHANITIEPWDYLYYAEQVRRARYNLDQNELRPYFELNHMIDARITWPNSSMACSFTRDHRHRAGVRSERTRVGSHRS